MDDALAVRLFERLGDLLADLERLGDGDRSARELLLEVFTLDELEGQEGLAVRLFEAVDREASRCASRLKRARRSGS